MSIVLSVNGAARSVSLAVCVALLARPSGAQQQSPVVTVFGEVRSRTEVDDPGAGAAPDAFSLLRSRFGVRVEPSSGSRVVLQLQDSRVLGTSPATSPPGSDVLDLHQAYVELTQAGATRTTSLRLGRQEIALGNERLVGAVGWSNRARTFDGARVTLTSTAADRWLATAFVAVVEERGRTFGGAAPGAGAPDRALAGAFLARRLGSSGIFESTGLFDAPGRYRAFDAARRATLGARLKATRPASLPVSFESEAAYQFGSQHYLPAAGAPVDQDISAYLVAIRLATPPAADRRFTVALGADVLSGDATPQGKTYTAFWTAYATNHPFYGLLDVIGDPATSTRERGLVDLLLTSTLPVRSRRARAEFHRFFLATGASRPLGWELDAMVPWTFGAARLDCGASAFVGDAGAAAVGLAPDGGRHLWGFLQVTLPF